MKFEPRNARRLVQSSSASRAALFILDAAIGLTASQGASAADLGRRIPPPASAYVPPAPLPYLWTGCYVGGNVGGAWAHVEVTDVDTGATASGGNSGFAGGGQIGCDYQWNAWVFGFRNMFDGTSLSSTRTFDIGSVDSHKKPVGDAVAKALGLHKVYIAE